jgi:hypothetical protein
MPKNTTRKVKKNYWGHHLIINAADCNPEIIRSPTLMKAFVKDLVDRIHMTAYGKPFIKRFGSGDLLGYSLFQMIETSNIACHFVEGTNDAYIDIFSCKKFNPEDAIDIIKKHFNPKRMQKSFLKRQA